MLALALPLLLLAQAPEAPPPAAAAAPAPSLGLTFIDKHLLSVEMSPFGGFRGLQIRQGARTLTMGEEGAEIFALVPEAAKLFASSQKNFVIGRALEVTALSLAGASLVTVLLATTVVRAIAPAVLLTISLVALAVCGVGLVLSLIALPYMMAANREFLEAVNVYNHGLLTLPAATGAPTAAAPTGELITVARF